jgi:hypothetical protein
MYLGIFIKLKSAIFRKYSVFYPGSDDQIGKKNFYFDSSTQGFIAKVYGN